MNYTLRYEETGEIRPPRVGEFFKGSVGVERARFDFRTQSFPIMREILEPQHDDLGEQGGNG
jgi:hypothetical protein